MRITNSQLVAKNKHLSTQLEAQGNPGRVALKAKMAAMAKQIETLSKQVDDSLMTITKLKDEAKATATA